MFHPAGLRLPSLFVVVLAACGSEKEQRELTPVAPPPSPPSADAGDDAGPVEPRSPIHFFISGHSLTDDPTADLIVEVATSRGVVIDYDEQIVIGSPIRWRTKGSDSNAAGFPGYQTGKNREGSDMDIVAELRSPTTLGEGARYDTLIITERHDLLGTIQWENTVGYLRQYHDLLIGSNPAARTFFFHSWLSLDKDAPEAWIEYETAALAAWECVAEKVNLTIESEGREDRVEVLPAGGAVVALVRRILAGEIPGITGTRRERLDVLFLDNVHLTPLGKYYSALVTFAAISGGSPVGSSAPEGVDPETAHALQETAAAYVEAYDPASRGMAACRAIAMELCEPFVTLVGRPDLSDECVAFYEDASSADNPFRWPDPTWTPLPLP